MEKSHSCGVAKVPPMHGNENRAEYICDRVCENRFYLHKIHAPIHFIISISFSVCMGYTISVSFIEFFRKVSMIIVRSKGKMCRCIAMAAMLVHVLLLIPVSRFNR